MLVAIGSLLAAAGLICGRSKKEPDKPVAEHPRSADYWVFCLLGMGLMLGVSLFSDRHWLPAESLTVLVQEDESVKEEIELAVTAYVVADNGAYVTYMGHESRSLRHVRNLDVVGRQACSIDEWWYPKRVPILALFAQDSALPICKDLVTRPPQGV